MGAVVALQPDLLLVSTIGLLILLAVFLVGTHRVWRAEIVRSSAAVARADKQLEHHREEMLLQRERLATRKAMMERRVQLLLLRQNLISEHTHHDRQRHAGGVQNLSQARGYLSSVADSAARVFEECGDVPALRGVIQQLRDDPREDESESDLLDRYMAVAALLGPFVNTQQFDRDLGDERPT